MRVASSIVVIIPAFKHLYTTFVHTLKCFRKTIADEDSSSLTCANI